MFPLLQLGPLAIRLPGLFLLAGVWLGTLLVDREAPRLKLSAAAFNNLVLYGLIAGIIGARLAYASRFLDVYAENPLSLISLNPSSLSPMEGAVIGLIVAVIYGQRQRLPLWPTLDALTPALAVFALSVGVAHLSSGDAFGAPTTVPWAIELWSARRHPAQIYEILAAGAILLAVWRVRASAPFAGFLFLLWVALSAAARLFLEAFRGDSILILGGLRAAQVASLGVLLLGLILMRWRARQEG